MTEQQTSNDQTLSAPTPKAAEVRTPAGRMLGATYAQHKGKLCPGCNSGGVRPLAGTGGLQRTIDGACELMECTDCGSQWMALYRVIGYDHFLTTATRAAMTAGKAVAE